MSQDNGVLQSDEIEAISAIYGDDWVFENPETSLYSIELFEDESIKNDKSDGDQQQQQMMSSNKKSIRLEIKLSPDYPLNGPPTYTISAPWMSRKEKTHLMDDLNEIYINHLGESILYMWIEKTREYLTSTNHLESRDQLQSDDGLNSEKKHMVTTHDPETNVPDDKNYNAAAAAVENQGDKDIQGNPDDDGSGEFEYLKFKNRQRNHVKNGNSSASEPSVNIFHGEPLVDRRSVFQAHVARVDCLDHVNQVIDSLKSNKKIATATHNISAYRLSGGPHNTCIQDSDDDGETHAGGRLLHLLQILDVKDVVVVVSRWFGGIQLGPDRFKHINNVTRDLLEKCNLLPSVESSLNNQSSKKNKKR